MEIVNVEPVSAITAGSWIVYFKMIDDHVTSVAVDLALEQTFEREKFGRATALEIKFQGNAGGLTTNAEAEQLDAISEAFEGLANSKSFLGKLLGSSSPNVIFAGRCTRNCVRQYFYYSHNAIPGSVFNTLKVRFPSIQFQVLERPDPTWWEYKTNLHPGTALNPLQLMWAELDLRIKHKDQLIEPRDVDYDVEFQQREEREAFLESVSKQGWNIRRRTDPKESESGERKWQASLVRHHRIDRMWSDIYLVALCSRLDRFKGTYLGRGAPEIH